MRRKKGFSPIAQVIASAAKRGGWKKKFEQYEIWAKWNEIVGEGVARHAQPASWSGRILIIEVDSASWVQELNMMKNDLKKKIRTLLPELPLRDLRFYLKRDEFKRDEHFSPENS